MSSPQPDIENFQSEPIEYIKTFVTLAKEKGIEGVSFKYLEKLGEGVNEFCLEVDNNNLVLVIREDIYSIDISHKKWEIMLIPYNYQNEVFLILC